MIREFTCIVCPNGCSITADYEKEEGKAPVIRKIQGNLCKRGAGYVSQELISPVRTFATSVAVRNGELPLVSVRLTKPIPRDQIFRAMDVIRTLSVDAPVAAGAILCSHILGYDSDVIATKNVPAAQTQYSSK